jgi:hypothetical protein
MKARLLLLIFLMFFASMQFFGQGIHRTATTESKTTVSSKGCRAMKDGAKMHEAKAPLKSAVEVNEELRLEITCNANSYSDEVLVIFNHSNPNEGAEKFYSMYATAPELWTMKNGNNYTINFMGELYAAEDVPLAVKAGAAGNYTITASQVESFGSSTEIILEDRDLGILANLGATPAYTFNVNGPATLADRFFLHFLNVTSVPDKATAELFNMYAFDGFITIKSKQQSGKITVFDLSGRKIAAGRIDAGGSALIDMHGNTGVYIVSVYTGKEISNTKIIVR